MSEKDKRISKLVDLIFAGCGQTMLSTIILPPGNARNTVFLEVARRLVKEKDANVLFLFKHRALCQQFLDFLLSDAEIECFTKDEHIKFDTYDGEDHKGFYDAVFCFEADSLSKFSEDIFRFDADTTFGIFTTSPNVDNFFYNVPSVYEENVVFNKELFFDSFVLPIFGTVENNNFFVKYNNSRDRFSPIDVELRFEKYNLQFGLLSYHYADENLGSLKLAVKAFNCALKEIKNANGVLISLSTISEKYKNEVVDKYGIIIWDIKNLVYFAQDNEELDRNLRKLLPFSIQGIEPTEPREIQIIVLESNETAHVDIGDLLYSQLENCKPGKKEAYEFEKICSSIVEYLFNDDLYRPNQQFKTNDEMFRMDLICSIKSDSSIWKFLKDFYRTKFIVFEFKNYSKQIDQNLIVVTDKYLFKPALRNVAFIVSRKGFDLHAKKIAEGLLKSEGTLIIDLVDDDLFAMINKKQKGENPSDYLLEKVENYLMGISI